MLYTKREDVKKFQLNQMGFKTITHFFDELFDFYTRDKKALRRTID